jgi:hypothetical protein
MELSTLFPSLVVDPLPGRFSTTPPRYELSSKTVLRAALELAYPLAGDPQLGAKLSQGRRSSLVEAVAAHQDVPFTGRDLSH